MTHGRKRDKYASALGSEPPPPCQPLYPSSFASFFPSPPLLNGPAGRRPPAEEQGPVCLGSGSPTRSSSSSCCCRETLPAADPVFSVADALSAWVGASVDDGDNGRATWTSGGELRRADDDDLASNLSSRCTLVDVNKYGSYRTWPWAGSFSSFPLCQQ